MYCRMMVLQAVIRQEAAHHERALGCGEITLINDDQLKPAGGVLQYGYYRGHHGITAIACRDDYADIDAGLSLGFANRRLGKECQAGTSAFCPQETSRFRPSRSPTRA